MRIILYIIEGFLLLFIVGQLIGKVMADPDFQLRGWVQKLAAQAGCVERARYGNWFSYSLIFEKI